MRKEDGSDLGEVDQIQDQGKAVPEAKVGMQVAISMDKPIAGRHVFEKDILYVKVPEKDAKAMLTTHADDLTADEQECSKSTSHLCARRRCFGLEFEGWLFLSLFLLEIWQK